MIWDRELHGDGDDGSTTVMGLDFMTDTVVIAGMGTTFTVCFEVFQHEIHGMVPFWKLICYLSIIYGNGDGHSCLRGRTGTGTISKLVAGIGVGMGIRVMGTVRDGYKYMSRCISLLDCVIPLLRDK